MEEFKIGDEVFHKSNSSIKWIIEKVFDQEIHCSTLIKETLEYREEVFSVTSIQRYVEPKTIVVTQRRDNEW